MKEDREILIGEGHIYLDRDNIIYAAPVGEIDEKIAIEFKDGILKFMNRFEGKVNGIVDLNKCGKQSSKARAVFEELNDDKKVGKLAFFGMHPVARVLASFAMGVSKNKDMRFFKTKEEALAWLKEE